MPAASSSARRGYGYQWRRLRLVVLARDEYVCRWCGADADQVDHVTAIAEGGAVLDPANLVASCTRCNMVRGGRIGGERTSRRHRLHPSRRW